MNAPSVDIKDMLEAESSLGLIFKTNLFVGREPTEPNDCVTIFDTPGGPPQLVLGQEGNDYYSPSVHIRVRNISYIKGYDLARDIMIALHARAQEIWNETLYSVIKSMGDPALLDWDENGRSRFVINFDMQRR